MSLYQARMAYIEACKREFAMDLEMAYSQYERERIAREWKQAEIDSVDSDLYDAIEDAINDWNEQDCETCRGSGQCDECNGEGFTEEDDENPENCEACERSGNCPDCEGTGKRFSDNNDHLYQ